MNGDPEISDGRPEMIALALHRRLQSSLEHGKALRDVAAAIAE